PIVSGNVSLYNETDGRAILPTPTIGAVGLIADTAQIIARNVRAGDVALLVGETKGHLGQSALLAEMQGREEGDAPPVDLAAEKRNGEFIRAYGARFTACTDLGDGGLALAAFELAEGAGLGVTLDAATTAQLFGEDQARYLVACAPSEADALVQAAKDADVPIARVGQFGGASVRFGPSEAALTDLSALFRGSFAKAVA
ncbi:MAG: phosphoribosylformylglycinamidine synthase II, partial [Pseudooceanicola sp.]|nr:phosphoribosylformylglycinamidine synthase II [Pseudooceanicola sp.]